MIGEVVVVVVLVAILSCLCSSPLLCAVCEEVELREGECDDGRVIRWLLDFLVRGNAGLS